MSTIPLFCFWNTMAENLRQNWKQNSQICGPPYPPEKRNKQQLIIDTIIESKLYFSVKLHILSHKKGISCRALLDLPGIF